MLPASPPMRKSSTPVMKFCCLPESFMMPAPLVASVKPGMTVIENALAPELNTMLLTSVPVETEMSVVFETSKVATTADSFGIVGGIQFVAVFQSPLSGVALQVALPAVYRGEREQVR